MMAIKRSFPVFYSKLANLRRRHFGAVRHFITDLPVVALTFDDGPDPQSTPRLLKILAQNHAKATFFMVGEAAQRYPEIVRAVADAGHAIGNHSWDHSRFPALSSAERRLQLRRCAEAIAPFDCKLFRPPFGSDNFQSQLDVRLAGYRMVNWNIDVPDWLGHSADWIEPRVLNQLEAGSILLFHDGLYCSPDPKFVDRGPTIEVVERLLRRIGSQCCFVTLPEMFRIATPRNHWLPLVGAAPDASRHRFNVPA